MAKKIKPADFRLKRSDGLRKFALALQEDPELAIDCSSIIDAAVECQTYKPEGKDTCWGYHLNHFAFYFQAPNKSFPKSINKNHLALELSVAIEGKCESRFGDPFEKLSVDIVVTSNQNDEEGLKILSWHLDRHISDGIDNEPKEVHPLYHFHYGGRRMYDLESYGNTLLLSPPRLQFPPMDGILAIDFALSNFKPVEWRRLREQSENYSKLIKEAQSLYWAPFFLSLVTTEELNDKQLKNTVPINELWPQYVNSK